MVNAFIQYVTVYMVPWNVNAVVYVVSTVVQHISVDSCDSAVCLMAVMLCTVKM